MARQLIRGILKITGAILAMFILYVIYLNWLKPVKLEHLTLETLDGKMIHTDSLFNNHMTIINFWATWCKPCIAEMPMLDSVFNSLDHSRWQMIVVSDEAPESINAFRNKREFSLPFMRSVSPLSELGVVSLPKTVIVDENRKVLYTKTGALTQSAKDFLALLVRYRD